MPADLVAAFARNARARTFFETLDGANRYAILYRVQTAKKPETRAERIKRFVAQCARHETIHPPRQTKSGAPLRQGFEEGCAQEVEPLPGEGLSEGRLPAPPIKIRFYDPPAT